MLLKRFQDVDGFLGEAGEFLLASEAENNLILGIARDLATSTLWRDQPTYLAAVTAGGQVVAAALRTPPHNLIISRAPAEAVEALAEDARRVYTTLPGVLGPSATSRAFAEAWCRRSGQQTHLGTAQRIYQAERVEMPPDVRGELRPAERAQANLILEWLRAFEAEAYGEGERPVSTAERLLEAYLEARTRGLYIWHDEQPVAMAGHSGRTPNGIRVGPVYTPPEFRRRGYGSAATAALSRRLFDSGYRYCFLFTDLSNPTSNSIYRRIGYRPVVDVDEHHFTT